MLPENELVPLWSAAPIIHCSKPAGIGPAAHGSTDTLPLISTPICCPLYHPETCVQVFWGILSVRPASQFTPPNETLKNSAVGVMRLRFATTPMVSMFVVVLNGTAGLMKA